MAKVAPQRAAELTGRSKSTIQRAMTTGKLSYEVEEGGRRVIDTAELDRAFGLLPQGNDNVVQASLSFESELAKATQRMETERLQLRLKLLEEQLDGAKEQIIDLKVQRDEWQKQAQQVMLSSQYSQKQAQELKDELKERERKARALRQQEMERRAKAVAENQNRSAIKKAGVTVSLPTLLKKLRGKRAA